MADMAEETNGEINQPKKDYNREMHTAEHILKPDYGKDVWLQTLGKYPH